jgi:hypothetical protein
MSSIIIPARSGTTILGMILFIRGDIGVTIIGSVTQG